MQRALLMRMLLRPSDRCEQHSASNVNLTQKHQTNRIGQEPERSGHLLTARPRSPTGRLIERARKTTRGRYIHGNPAVQFSRQKNRRSGKIAGLLVSTL